MWIHQPGYHVAAMGTEAVRFLVLWMAGWIHARQLEVINFLREENRVLREQIGGRRLRFTDDQRRRLAVKGRIVGRRRLGEFAGLVTPDTILRWYRELIARKYEERVEDAVVERGAIGDPTGRRIPRSGPPTRAPARPHRSPVVRVAGSALLLPTVVRQRRRSGGFDVAAARRVRDFLERKGYPHEFAIIPRAPHQLDVDRLAVVVVSGGESDRRDSVGRTRRVASAETSLAAAAVVQADVAQESRIDHRVDAEMIGACSVHPCLRRRLTPSPVVAEHLHFGV